MRIAVTYGPMCLQRSAEETWADPRTGSEVGWRRIVEELRKLGHWVDDEIGRGRTYDCAISINEPDSLRDPALIGVKLRICCFWLNRFEFCQPGFDDHVDIYLSPSQAHLDQVLGAWGAQKPEKWRVNQLGCDLADYSSAIRKVPGRVVHTSSPDRGLHRLLEAWPSIKRAAPHAHLQVFYRLEEWMRAFDTTAYYPPIERNRQRALYIAEALKRLSGPEWGIEVRDSVDRTTLARELREAEVFAFPCETMSWSEGFSCSTLEACAAEACPVLTDCDALGDVYRDLDPVPVGNWTQWRDDVVRALTDPAFRAQRNKKARALAEKLTWKAHAQRLDEVIRERLK